MSVSRNVDRETQLFPPVPHITWYENVAPREWGMKTQICTSVSGSFPSATAISCVGCADTSPPVVERVPERGLQGFSSCSTFDLYHAVPRLLPQSVQPEV